MNENKEKDFVTSDNKSSICGGDAPVDSRITDEHPKVLVVGADMSGRISNELIGHLEDRNIIIVDNIENVPKLPIASIIPDVLLPYMAMPNLESEKKKKKPCTYHEYIAFKQKAGDNYIISKWACRHCGKEL